LEVANYIFMQKKNIFEFWSIRNASDYVSLWWLVDSINLICIYIFMQKIYIWILKHKKCFRLVFSLHGKFISYNFINCRPAIVDSLILFYIWSFIFMQSFKSKSNLLVHKFGQPTIFVYNRMFESCSLKMLQIFRQDS